MELNFSKIVNRERKAVEMTLYGDIGDDVENGEINGHRFAAELRWLGREYDEVKIRINSNGGSVDHGLSIVSEMMASQAFIIAQVDGIAASMAAILLAAADKVTMNDYAKVMIHAPYMIDENGEAVRKLSAKAQKSISALKDTLKVLLSKRGMSDDEITTAMRTDTWYTADEALQAKLVDEVITTGKKELAALEPMRLVAKINESHNSKSMNKVIAKLKGLGCDIADNANEDQIVAALDHLPTGDDNKPSEQLVNRLIAVGKKTGVVTDGETGNEAKFRKLAVADLDLFMDMLGLDKIEAPKASAQRGGQARMSELVAQAKANGGGGAAKNDKDFEWYERNDPEALAKMEKLEPEKFAELKAADDAKYE